MTSTTTGPTVTRTDTGGVATITLQSPGLTGRSRAELTDLLRAVSADESVRAVVLTGAGRAFCVGQDLAEHVAALRAHLPEDVFQYVLANNRTDVTIPEKYPSQVVAAAEENTTRDYHVVFADVVNPESPLRHDPAKLAQALIRLYYEKAASPPAVREPTASGAGPR